MGAFSADHRPHSNRTPPIPRLAASGTEPPAQSSGFAHTLSPMARELHDHFFREAKREGYRSRAAYKLIEMDDRRKLLRRGDRVLDCGTAPGSWLQVIAARIGPKGRVVGVDLQPVDTDGLPAWVRTLEGDLRDITADQLADAVSSTDRQQMFDVILSDMAPSTTGDRTIDHFGSIRLCELVLDRVPELLRTGGHVALKVLEGEAYPDLMKRARTLFEQVRSFKPKASRSVSTEIYLVGQVRRSNPS